MEEVAYRSGVRQFVSHAEVQGVQMGEDGSQAKRMVMGKLEWTFDRIFTVSREEMKGSGA